MKRLPPPESPGIAHYGGVPQRPDAPGERTRWEKFLAALPKWLGGKDRLADDYVRAGTARTDGEAQKFVAEAKEIGARADAVGAETTKVLVDLIGQIASDDSGTPAAKELQLEIVAARHPEVRGQIERIKERIARLRVVHGARIEAAANDATAESHEGATRGTGSEHRESSPPPA